MDSSDTIKYAGVRDKCYGVAGMTIALAVYDKEQSIESVSVDRPDIDSISFCPDFRYVANQHMSAKSAWVAAIEHFRIVAALLIANVMCRNMVMKQCEVTHSQLQTLLSLITEEGIKAYQLDDDECSSIFNNNYRHLYRVFAHPAVHDVTHRLCLRLEENREIFRSELLELLSAL